MKTLFETEFEMPFRDESIIMFDTNTLLHQKKLIDYSEDIYIEKKKKRLSKR